MNRLDANGPNPEPSLLSVISLVKGPRPVLSRADEADLTSRQREVLDQLLAAFSDGFRHLTMAEIAAAVSCSLRTLYELAPSRDDLVLMVVDRHMWQVGRSAVEAVSADMNPLDAIRSYLRAANEAVAHTNEPFAADTHADRRTRDLTAAHSQYLIDVTRALLDHAIAEGEIAPINTRTVARVLAGLGADLSRPEVIGTLDDSPKDAANEMVDIIMVGLRPHTVG